MFHPTGILRIFLSVMFFLFGLLALMLSCVTLYAIFTRSPKHLKGYRWVLANLSVSSLVFDFSSSLAQPIIAGHYCGAFYITPIPMGPFFIMLFSCFILVGLLLQVVALHVAFYYRLLAVLSGNYLEFFRYLRFIFFPLIYLTLAIMVSLQWITYSNDLPEIIQHSLRTDPGLAVIRNESMVIILPPDDPYMILYLEICSSFTAFTVVWLGSLTIFIFYKLYLQPRAITGRTLRSQKRMIVLLLMQSSIPVVCIGIPFTFFLLAAIGFEFVPDILVALCTLIGSTHTMLNSLITLCLIPPYRRFFFAFVKGMCHMIVHSISNIFGRRDMLAPILCYSHPAHQISIITVQMQTTKH